jgi:hypothetical protein
MKTKIRPSAGSPDLGLGRYIIKVGDREFYELAIVLPDHRRIGDCGMRERCYGIRRVGRVLE